LKIASNKEIYVRYLLGDQPESERERLEQEYFANPEILQELYLAEDDLIDAYVRGVLTARQGEQFEKYYLDSAGKRQRVEFARTLWATQRDQERPESNMRHSSVWSFLVSKPALAAALSLVLMFLALMELQNWRLRSEVSQGQSAQAHLQDQIQELRQVSAALQAELVRRTDWPLTAEGATVSMLLLPALERGGGSKSHLLSIPSHVASVVLALDIDQAPGGPYRAVLETAEGVAVRSFENLKSYPLKNGDQAVFLIFPDDSLGRGDFVIRVFSRPDQKRVVELHPYSLRVVR
jgi:hypothetical protein